MQLGTLRTSQKTQQLRQDILSLQESLKTTDNVSAEIVRSRSSKLGFGFYTPDMNADPPSVTQGRAVEGYVPVEISVFNHSAVTAVNGEIYLRICDGCKYAEEPQRSIRIEGAMEKERVFQFGAIATRSRLEKFQVKIIPSDTMHTFEVALRYTCQTCVENDWQVLTVRMSE